MFISRSREELIKDGFKTGVREDERELLESRNLDISYNDKRDGVEIALGKTKVFGKLSAAIVEPRPDKQNQGFLVTRIDLSPLTAQTKDSKALRCLKDEITKVCENTIKGSR